MAVPNAFPFRVAPPGDPATYYFALTPPAGHPDARAEASCAPDGTGRFRAAVPDPANPAAFAFVDAPIRWLADGRLGLDRAPGLPAGQAACDTFAAGADGRYEGARRAGRRVLDAAAVLAALSGLPVVAL